MKTVKCTAKSAFDCTSVSQKVIYSYYMNTPTTNAYRHVRYKCCVYSLSRGNITSTVLKENAIMIIKKEKGKKRLERGFVLNGLSSHR